MSCVSRKRKTLHFKASNIAWKWLFLFLPEGSCFRVCDSVYTFMSEAFGILTCNLFVKRNLKICCSLEKRTDLIHHMCILCVSVCVHLCMLVWFFSVHVSVCVSVCDSCIICVCCMWVCECVSISMLVWCVSPISVCLCGLSLSTLVCVCVSVSVCLCVCAQLCMCVLCVCVHTHTSIE